MGIDDALALFEQELRRLRREAEPTLYPAYVSLVTASYPDSNDLHVDTNRHTSGTGFPDLTIIRGALCLNWVEIKSPTVSVDPLPRPDQERFDRYRKTLPHVVLTNGHSWKLFQHGECTATLSLPPAWLLERLPLSADERASLVKFLRRCAGLSPEMAQTGDEAVTLLATAAEMIRSTIASVPEAEYPAQLRSARESFTKLLQTNPEDVSELRSGDFADALAQTTVFGYLLGRIEAQSPIDPSTAHAALSTTEHPFLKHSLYGLSAPEREMESLLKGVLRAACDLINRAAPQLAGPDGDWSQVTYVYEKFFAEYRPEDRFKFGVFYTPMEITRYQVREVSRTLREEFGLSGLLDPAVRVLDPACGTGTYLLALAELAAEEAEQAGLPTGAALKDLFGDRVVGFEVSPGPSCVAQARLSSWLRSPPHNVNLGKRFPIYTVNTLTPPAIGSPALTGNLWSDNVGSEQAEGDRVKAKQPVLVVLGNPPWGRRDKQHFDLATTDKGGKRRNLLSDWAKGASGAAQSVYDLYVAFWRFACHMLLERGGVQEPKGIVSFITNRTWLRGRPFTTVRSYMREHGVNAQITDLGGDIRAGEIHSDEGVFAIQAGCAVATLSFGASTGAGTRFRRLLGTREQKLRALETEAEWRLGPTGKTDPFAPADWGALDLAKPVNEFFRKSLPGVKTHRDHLVVGLDEEELFAKLDRWNRSDPDERKSTFHPSYERDLPATNSIDRAAIKKYRYRPLDERALYTVSDFIQRPGTISKVYQQLPSARHLQFLDSGTISGPVVIATNTLPDYHAVRGSYGSKTVLVDPLPGRDSRQRSLFSAEPSHARDLLSEWGTWWANKMNASVEAVACYLLALGNAPSYIDLFGNAVKSEPPRMPATLDKEVFDGAVEVGKRLMDAWCLRAPPAGKWRQKAPPGTPLGEATPNSLRIEFENGDLLEEVPAGVWDLEVSGYPVLRRYLEARENSTLTVELAANTQKVVGSLAVILAEQEACDRLLERALASPMFDTKSPREAGPKRAKPAIKPERSTGKTYRISLKRRKVASSSKN